MTSAVHVEDHVEAESSRSKTATCTCKCTCGASAATATPVPQTVGVDDKKEDRPMTVLTAVLQSLYNYETIRRNLQKPRLKEPEWQLLEKLLEDLYEGRVRLQSQVERMSHVLILPAGDVQQHAKNLIHDAFWIFNMFGNQAKSTFATVSKSEAEEMSGDWSIQTDSSTNPTGLGS